MNRGDVPWLQGPSSLVVNIRSAENNMLGIWQKHVILL